jgi:hypothetical protein
MSWILHQSWWRDRKIHWRFSVFASIPTSLLSTVYVSVLSIRACLLSPTDLLYQHKAEADLFYNHVWFPLTSWMAHCRRKFKSSGDKTSPSLRQSWKGKGSNQFIIIRASLYFLFKRVLISLPSFMDTQILRDSIRIPNLHTSFRGIHIHIAAHMTCVLTSLLYVRWDWRLYIEALRFIVPVVILLSQGCNKVKYMYKYIGLDIQTAEIIA